MKKVSVLVAAAVVSGMFFTSCGPKTNVSLKSDVDSVSYAIGVSTGLGYKENLKTLPGAEANVDALIAGFVQAIKGDSTKMNMEEAREYMQKYFVEASAKEAIRQKKKAKSSWLIIRQRVVSSLLKAACSIRLSQKAQALNRQLKTM